MAIFLKVFGYYFRQTSHFFQRKSVGRLHFFVGKNVYRVLKLKMALFNLI